MVEINELKKMLKSSTAVLIVENGSPSFVIVDYSTYKKLNDAVADEPKKGEYEFNGSGSAMTHVGSEIQARQTPPTPDAEILEKINKEIMALKAEIEKEEKNVGAVD